MSTPPTDTTSPNTPPQDLAFADFFPSIAVLIGVIVVLLIAYLLLERRGAAAAGHRFRNQSIMLALTAAGLVAVVLALPWGAERGTVVAGLGILLSAAIALSSTTFLGNAMAGVMLRAARSFAIGDFIRCAEHFGRVSERGLFHTEIQTEHRNFAMLPNLYLVSNSVTTIRASGTLVSATVSLGYDVPWKRIEELLLEAARKEKLEEPFVHVIELGDFSVTYRVAGLLTDVKRLLTVRSRLNAAVLDALHGGAVEIVSPNFMNQRVLDPSVSFIPKPTVLAPEPEVEPPRAAEDLMFDKAEEAASLETLRARYLELGEKIDGLTKELGEAAGAPEREGMETRIADLQARRDRLEKRIERREQESSND